MDYFSDISTALFGKSSKTKSINNLKGEPNIVKDLRSFIVLNQGGSNAWIRGNRLQMDDSGTTYDFGRIVDTVDYTGYSIITTEDKCIYI